MAREIFKYVGLALVAVGIVVVMKGLFTSDTEWKETTIKKSTKSTYNATVSLIDKDTKQLHGIIERTRIFFGACHPISYQMIESLATDEGLDYYPEQPQYLICGTSKIDATFTKQEFLDSIQKAKVKKLEKK